VLWLDVPAHTDNRLQAGWYCTIDSMSQNKRVFVSVNGQETCLWPDASLWTRIFNKIAKCVLQTSSCDSHAKQGGGLHSAFYNHAFHHPAPLTDKADNNGFSYRKPY